jgi:LPXTG-site transpeptidase (sortase) family protein
VALLVFVVACLALVAYNEYNMSKNRPARKSLIQNQNSEDQRVVDETTPSDDQVAEYQVAPSKPRYLSIPSLGIKNARVREVGVQSDGRLGTPVNIFDTAWYNKSSLPGGGGAVLIDGHNGGPTLDGVFKHLDSLAEGSTITLERGDGALFNYRVVEKKVMNVAETDAYMAAMLTSAEAGKEGLNLITCTGNWIRSDQTYDKRVTIRAVLE